MAWICVPVLLPIPRNRLWAEKATFPFWWRWFGSERCSQCVYQSSSIVKSFAMCPIYPDMDLSSDVLLLFVLEVNCFLSSVGNFIDLSCPLLSRLLKTYCITGKEGIASATVWGSNCGQICTLKAESKVYVCHVLYDLFIEQRLFSVQSGSTGRLGEVACQPLAGAEGKAKWSVLESR